MVEKVTVNPDDVRGLGNVIIPKSLSDYWVCDSSLVEDSEVIENYVLHCLSVGYRAGSYLVYNDSKWITPSDSSFSVSVTLKKHSDDSVISSAFVKCIVNGDVEVNATTNSNGVATFSIPVVSGLCSYKLLFKYPGISSVAGCFLPVMVHTGSDTGFELDLTGDKEIIQTTENSILVASLTGVDCNGETVGVQGRTVYFYEEYVLGVRLTGSAPIIQSGGTSTLTGQLIDAEDGSLVRESGDTVYYYDSNCTKYTDTASSDKSSDYIGSNTTSALSYDSTNKYYTLTRSELSQTPYWLDFGIIPINDDFLPIDFRFSLDMYCSDRTPSSGGYNWFMGLYDGTSSNAMLLGMQSTKWVVRKYTDNDEITLVEGNNLWPTSTWHTYIMEVNQRSAQLFDAKVTVKEGTTKLFENTYSFLLDYVPRLCLMSNYCVSTHYLKNINFEVI